MNGRRTIDLLNEAQVEHQRVQGWAYEQSGACGIVCACGWKVSMDGGILRDSLDWAEAAWREHLSCVFIVALDLQTTTRDLHRARSLLGDLWNYMEAYHDAWKDADDAPMIRMAVDEAERMWLPAPPTAPVWPNPLGVSVPAAAPEMANYGGFCLHCDAPAPCGKHGLGPAPAVPVAPPEPPLVLSELDRTRLVGEFRRKAEDWGLLATTNDPGTAASTEAMYESLVDALNTGRPIVGAPLPAAPPVPERED